MINAEDSIRSDLNWATIIPKIGGAALGCYQATGVLPSFHLSYPTFQDNDSHLARYWPTVPFTYLTGDKQQQVDQVTHQLQGQQMDFVTAVCPCGGLSMLNTSKGGKAGRGSDSLKNDWMISTAELVLETVRPKVFWGENAPALFSKSGRPVVDKLRAVGQRFGYSFSIVKTNSELHGLPQRRVRTFYFFWGSPTAPLLSLTPTPAPKLLDFLRNIPAEASLQTMFVHEGVASERYRPYQFVLEREGLTHKEFSRRNSRGITVAKYLEKNNLMGECVAWLRKHHPTERFSCGTSKTHIQVLEHMQNKLSLGLGYWDDSVKLMGDTFTAVIKKNLLFAVHPEEDRFLNVRELLHLMGMPHDFKIDSLKNINHICQTVPVPTARDFAQQVVSFCQDKLDLSQFSFVMQDNVTNKVVETFPDKPSDTISDRKRKSGH